jgi:hypothetical protein
MFLAYLDESGDSGIDGSPTRFFVLSCVLVHESAWLDSLDSLIALRRALRETYDIPTRPEIKARHFHNGRGPLRHLRWSQADRMELFRRVLCQVGDSLNFRVFGIAIDKVPARKRGWEARMAAWTFSSNSPIGQRMPPIAPPTSPLPPGSRKTSGGSSARPSCFR